MAFLFFFNFIIFVLFWPNFGGLGFCPAPNRGEPNPPPGYPEAPGYPRGTSAEVPLGYLFRNPPLPDPPPGYLLHQPTPRAPWPRPTPRVLLRQPTPRAPWPTHPQGALAPTHPKGTLAEPTPRVPFGPPKNLFFLSPKTSRGENPLVFSKTCLALHGTTPAVLNCLHFHNHHILLHSCVDYNPSATPYMSSQGQTFDRRQESCRRKQAICTRGRLFPFTYKHMY